MSDAEQGGMGARISRLMDHLEARPAGIEPGPWLSRLEREAWDLITEPLAPTFQKFAALADQLAQAEGLELSFQLSDAAFAVDEATRGAVSLIVLHALRNSLAHGIEPPAERLKLGKPRAGMFRIEAGLAHGALCLRLTDDGRGVDLAALAEAHGVDPTERLADLLELLFRPGQSSRASVDAQAGFGVGLDAVATAVREVGGAVRAFLPTEAPGFGLEIELPLRRIALEAVELPMEWGGLERSVWVPASQLRLESPLAAGNASSARERRLEPELTELLLVSPSGASAHRRAESQTLRNAQLLRWQQAPIEFVLERASAPQYRLFRLAEEALWHPWRCASLTRLATRVQGRLGFLWDGRVVPRG